MATYQAVDITELNDDLYQIADSIRDLLYLSTPLNFPNDFIEQLQSTDAQSFIERIKHNYVTYVYSKQISHLDNDYMTLIPQNFQSNNKQLVSANLPAATDVLGGAFQGCTGLSQVHLPNLSHISGSAAFSSCSFPSLYLPSLVSRTSDYQWGQQWGYNSQLQKVYFPIYTDFIDAADFISCRQLSTVILGGNAVCPLKNENAFQGTPIRDKKTGYIYVPKALINDYQVAENWSVYSTQFRAIEDYPEVLEGWE